MPKKDSYHIWLYKQSQKNKPKRKLKKKYDIGTQSTTMASDNTRTTKKKLSKSQEMAQEKQEMAQKKLEHQKYLDSRQSVGKPVERSTFNKIKRTLQNPSRLLPETNYFGQRNVFKVDDDNILLNVNPTGFAGAGMQAVDDVQAGNYGSAALNALYATGVGATLGKAARIPGRMRLNKMYGNTALEKKFPVFESNLNYTPGGISGKDARTTVRAFKERVASPEGQRRMRNLGINPEYGNRRLQTISLSEANKNAYSPGRNNVMINSNSYIAPRTTRHELEHGVQAATNSGGPTIIDNDLKNLQLIQKPTHSYHTPFSQQQFDGYRRVGYGSKEKHLDILRDKKAAIKYFNTGSGGREKAPFLAEMQQYMLDKNYINHPYDNITPSMVESAVHSARSSSNHGDALRIANIIEPTQNNYNIMSRNLNRMLGVATPIGLAGAYGLTQQRRGGVYKRR